MVTSVEVTVEELEGGKDAEIPLRRKKFCGEENNSLLRLATGGQRGLESSCSTGEPENAG